MSEDREHHSRTGAEHDHDRAADVVHDKAEREAEREADLIADKEVHDQNRISESEEDRVTRVEERKIERDRLRKWLIPILASVAFIVTLIAVGSLVLANRVSDNTDQIAVLEAQHTKDEAKVNALQDKALKAIRLTDYRICHRGQITRAALNLNVAADRKTPTPHTAGITFVLYDCTPNKNGQPAVPLTPAQTKAFEHYVETTKNLP